MKKTLPRTDSEFRQRRADLFRELALESDRGAVLVGASLLEECLELVLRSVMRREEKIVKRVVDGLFEGAGALSTFSAKTKCCFALNLIDEMAFVDLETIRLMRNEFAHSYRKASFLNQDIGDMVNSLHTGKLFEDRISASGDGGLILEDGKPAIKMPEAKRKLIVSVSFLGSYFEAHTRGFDDLLGQRTTH